LSGLADTAPGGDGEATFPAAAPARRIDAVLADPRVRVESHQVLDGPLARRASDHLPVLADLLLPDPPPARP
ncbi:MAG TPA: endonuclease, partial [Rugosimonospora sp.]|nr:endonuclease [Rugosimonospora sp.]